MLKIGSILLGVVFVAIGFTSGMIGCGSSGRSSYKVGGKVTGLAAAASATPLVLQNNGKDDLSITADGEFEFATPVIDLASYSITVLQAPPSIFCLVENNFGIVAGNNFSGVIVTCSKMSCTDGIKNNDETDVDCGGPGCPACDLNKECVISSDCLTDKCIVNRCRFAYHNCKEILSKNATAKDGVYQIDPFDLGPLHAFDVYCDMTTDGGGWTLALKADGNNSTFKYDSLLWTTLDLLGNSPGFDHTEAKFESFNTVPFTEVLLGLELYGTPVIPAAALAAIEVAAVAPSTNYIKISYSAPSLLSVFNKGDFVSATAVGVGANAGKQGRDAWMSLLGTASVLQIGCNREGFNTFRDLSDTYPLSKGDFTKVRFGILANEGDCVTPDSFIGIGSNIIITETNYVVGNYADCYGTPPNYNCGVHTALPAFGYLLVR